MSKSITSNQIFSLFNLHLFTTVIAFIMGLLISGSKYSTPVSVLLGSFLAFVLVYPSYKVASSRPDEFVTEFGGQLVGRVPHVILILYLVLINILLSALNLREMTNFLLSVYLINTPSWAIVMIFGICIAYAVRSGLPTIFRAAQGIFLVSAIAFLLIPFLAMQEIDRDALIALVSHLNVKDVSMGVYYNISMFGELAFLFLLYPFLKEPKKVMKTYFWTIVISLVIIMSHLIPVLLTFGAELAPNLIYPDAELIRFIRAGSFIETLDPILIILWLTSIFAKIAFLSFTAVICVSQLMKVKDHKPFALPIVAFICIFSIAIARSQPELTEFMGKNLTPFVLIAEYIVPIFYWLMIWIRGPKKKAKPVDTESAGS
ncbi:spore germination protein KB [Fontibacillus phaseoli]|uniref:Spore germination protein KB n=1 Tax=Fontibacillus phaseoli TaxID=1416533 RepID=A0A369BUY7_9BACL|nr:GerAB/ArcD/ProY family transporter [Fontibacillus phaseoli]RCX23424.1 spore germination protein KB [Fontibacillus phaseoli]